LRFKTWLFSKFGSKVLKIFISDSEAEFEPTFEWNFETKLFLLVSTFYSNIKYTISFFILSTQCPARAILSKKGTDRSLNSTGKELLFQIAIVIQMKKSKKNIPSFSNRCIFYKRRICPMANFSKEI
jgi:hypothetical protein